MPDDVGLRSINHQMRKERCAADAKKYMRRRAVLIFPDV
jgi:hypothetical protein